MSAIGKTVSLCLLFIGAVLVMFVVSVIREPQLSDEQMREKGVFLLPVPRDIAPFSLTDHTNGDFSNEDLQGRWSFIFFGFTHCPDICPTTMAVLGQVDLALRSGGEQAGAPFQGILVSVDPERDTPEKLAQYATAFSPRFIGAVGSRDALVELTQQLNVAFAKVPDGEGGYTVDHTGNLVIVNPRGHYHGFIKLPHQADTIRLTYQTLATRF